MNEFSKSNRKKVEDTIFSYIVKDYNIKGDLGSAEGCIMPKDLSRAILYESTFKECEWGECNWDSLSGNGSKFISCDFYTNLIHNSALQHALFDSSVFYNCQLSGSNFAHSVFSWSIFKKCPINGCAFTGTFFNHISFEDAKIVHSNFELCKFDDVDFINMDLSELALKYTIFRNTRMKNVILPFMQLPYTFGGMQLINSSTNDIKISTSNKKHSVISVDKYKKLLPQLISFFKGHDDYFPLANCYLSKQEYRLAEKANRTGLLNSAASGDFRKLYFFCVQATQEIKISREKRSELYKLINDKIRNIKMHRAEYQEFTYYFPMIKRLMLDNPNNKPTLLLSFHTNIEADDFRNLSVLMSVLDELSEECGVNLDSKHIEIRHNSPNILDWLPVGNIEELLSLLQNTWNVIYPILSTVLQEASNITTVITGIYGLHKLRNLRREKKQQTVNNRRKIKNIRTTLEENDSNKNHDKIETLKLRINLLKLEKLWEDNNCNSSQLSNNLSSKMSKQLLKKIEYLKSVGIMIDTLEIQLLDDKSDVLEQLYNSNIDLS